MAGYNRIIIVGNLTRDPELKQLPSGQGVCRMSIATNRQFKNRQTGMQTQEVCYIDVDVWGVQAESCQKFLAKGRSVLVEGRLKFDTWQDQQGATRSKHSVTADRVVFLSNAGGHDAEDHAGMGADSSDYGPSEKVSFATQDTAEFSKIEQELAKKRKQAEAAKKAAPVKRAAIEGLAEFKDEAPFEDDLPF